MSLYKRGRIWWADFSVHGVRHQVSTGMADRREAVQKERELVEQARKSQMPRKEWARRKLTDVVDLYLAERATDSCEVTVKKERQFLRPVMKVLGERTLGEITADVVLHYRAERKACGLSNVTINIEVGALRRILKRGKLWHRMAEDVKPLKEQPSEVGRALSPAQKQKLLEVAASKPIWELAYCAAILALNTTMRACEIRHLKWSDVDLLERKITVRRSKTAAGHRVIPLNSSAMLAFQRLRDRAFKFGSDQPEHYVFPTVEPGHFDPTKPMVNWRGAWRKLTKAAGLPGLRFHDLRHHAITELAERGEADLTIMSIAGHISRRMLEHYSHIRMEAKRQALDGLATSETSIPAPIPGQTYPTTLPAKAN